MSYKNWSFTLNNPTEEEIAHLKQGVENLNANYLVFQLEQGTAETPHLQGFIRMVKRFTLEGVKINIGRRCHLERSRGTVKQNQRYCTKEEGRLDGPWEYGDIPVQGKRNDLKDFVVAMKEKNMGNREIVNLYPEIIAKYPRFVNIVRDCIREENVPMQSFTPREGWQTDVYNLMRDEPESRKIDWYYDEHGNSGKSHLARSYARNNDGGCFLATSGKYSDILYAYASEGCPRVIIFDWCRSEEEKFPYGLLEKLKNGFFLCCKYESRQVFFNIPHILVFANFEPDRRQWSRDRLRLHIISQNNFSIFNQ